MNRTEAYILDEGDFYVDFDEPTQYYCVFGGISGFAYATCGDPGEADEVLARMKYDYANRD